MLVLSREIDEVLMIGNAIRVQILDVRGGRVRLGVTAPKDVIVHRQEVYDAVTNARSAKNGEAHEPHQPTEDPGDRPAGAGPGRRGAAGDRAGNPHLAV